MTEEKMHHHADQTVGSVHARHRHLHIPHIRFHRHEIHDRPLAGAPSPHKPLHWKLYACELIATAVLMFVGVGSNILLLAPASPLAQPLLDHPLLQTMLCGLLFGGAGTIAAFTPFGRVSGAHVNPSVTLAFSLGNRLQPLDALGYFCAQMLGAIAGTGIIFLIGQLLPSWSDMANSVAYAATRPTSSLPPLWSLASELVLTMGLIFALYYCASKKSLHLIALWTGALYFALANPLLAWVTGDSTNFARTLGPDLFSGDASFLWLYLIGPLMGAALAVLCIRCNLLGKLHLREARLVNFGHHGRVPRLEHPEATAHVPEPGSNAPVQEE